MRNFFLILFFAISFTSCEKVIEIDEEEVKPKLVLDGQFEADSTWSVRVSHSQSVLDNTEIIPVTDAEVKISDASGTFICQLTHTGDGIYEAPGFVPAAGYSYRIDASHNRYDAVYAISNIPPIVEIISFDTATVMLNYSMQKKGVIRFQDPPQVGNRYIISAFTIYYQLLYDAFGNIYDTTYYFYPTSLNSTSIYVEDNDIEVYREKLFLTDNLMSGNQVEVDFYVPGYFDSTTTFGFVLWHVSEDYFLFLRTLDKYMESAHDPFAQPVLVYSNVVNGRGIFAGYSKYQVELK